jgi:TrmH family RNA methyltransferase
MNIEKEAFMRPRFPLPCRKMKPEITLLKPSGSQLKLWEKLCQAKYRRQEGLFLAEGIKVVRELMKSQWRCSAILILEKKAPDLNDLLGDVPQGVAIYELPENHWVKLSQDKTPEGIMAVVAHPESEVSALTVLDEPGHLLLLYRISNPNNLGAVIRTAHWLGIRKIFISHDSVDFTNSKVVRCAMGSLFHATLVSGVDFERIMPEVRKQYLVVGSDSREGVAPRWCAKKTALILGSESHGLSETLLHMVDERWHIPGVEGADSLSLPQAAAIMMYACTRQTNEQG